MALPWGKRLRADSKTRIMRPEITEAKGARQRTRVVKQTARQQISLAKRARLQKQARPGLSRKGKVIMPSPVQAGPTARMPATPRVAKALTVTARPPVMGTPEGLEKKIRIFTERFLR